ncbi:MAG: DUF4190 domain-containing protein, partial [Bacteroidota bacterium]|nr:DUF4190 domain-containing protein [Bacteroidota bacterium]
MKKTILLINIGILLLLIQSCSITKRHYLPGYSVEWQKNKASEAPAASKNNLDVISFDDGRSPDEMPVSASIDKSESYTNSSKTFLKLSGQKKQFPVKSIEGCDVIALKNGEEINAKVLEITQTEIKYKRCDNLDGPTFIILKSNATKIKFSNGTTEVINSITAKPEESDYYSPASKPEIQPYSGEIIINRYALASMILAVLSILFFPLVPLPIIFGIIALKQIKRSPEAYTGKGMAIFGIILGGIIVLAL